MFKRILVPLDGSELSASILPQLRRLLSAGEEVVLLAVVDADHTTAHEREEGLSKHDSLEKRLATARAELNQQVETLSAQGIPARAQVQVGEPAAVIVSDASIDEPSLIAMSTHGRGGLARWVRGSVAERVLRRAEVPLLLVTPRVDPTRPFRRVLVALDGSARSAEILPLAAELARVHEAELILLRVGVVAPPIGAAAYPAWAPPAPIPTAEELEESVTPYLAQVPAGVNARVLTSTEASVSEAILEAVEREEADVLAMTTHGRSGFDRWLFGSISEKVLRHCKVPLLVKRTVPARGT